ncbi:accessory Sec system protein Asp1 [Staphylococcus haemolyticus]|uniref:accessory Sec system protein Asp1 n=1 Tax=Staphylococcus haemolyticus TaxID=1283 RepID=UPI001F0A71A7|nr:accessory Sec system protein Asp1 [Staphylococcus haemolyticus]MCH4475845.1 accessory Sec system protein Asp1 [Staphylococcus haemolyticus]
MKQFIPAWYDSNNWWDSTVVPFYIKRKTTEFDDMVSLMLMHHKNNEPFNTIILNYNPLLRLFLHRHELYEMNYWSLFDEIQGATHGTPVAIDYRELSWPEDTEFIYTPFQVMAIKSDNQFSKMIFSQEGYLICIEDYEHKTLSRKLIFDDRGFVSSIEIYHDGQSPMKRYYLAVKGQIIMTQDFMTEKITIQPEFYDLFQKKSYGNMDELIFEKIQQYNTSTLADDDKVIIAADKRHNYVLTDTFKPENMCFSLFRQRNAYIDATLLETIGKANQCIVDTQANATKLNQFITQNPEYQPFKIMRVTPFDAQMLPNISSQLYETNIGVWIDSLSEEDLKTVIDQLSQYVSQHEQTIIHLLTRLNENDIQQWLRDEINQLNALLNVEEEEFSPEVQDILQTELEEDEIEKVKLIYVPFEEDLMKELSQLRVIVDFNQEPDLYLQISSISAGVPQINRRETDYVDDKLNGLIIDNIQQLSVALNYFIDNLKNWNYSFAHSIKLSDEFSSEKIIQRLNSVIEGEIHGT